MDALIFSQSGIFRMQQLANCVYQKTGVRHRMATPEGMLTLLRDAGSSVDKDIRQHYDAFVGELNERQVDMLAERNVNMRKPVYASTVTPIRKAS